MSKTKQDVVFSRNLRGYIKDFFNDGAQEIAFYNGLRSCEEKQPNKNDAFIKELSDIIEDIQQTSLSNSLFKM